MVFMVIIHRVTAKLGAVVPDGDILFHVLLYRTPRGSPKRSNDVKGKLPRLRAFELTENAWALLPSKRSRAPAVSARGLPLQPRGLPQRDPLIGSDGSDGSDESDASVASLWNWCCAVKKEVPEWPSSNSQAWASGFVWVDCQKIDVGFAISLYSPHMESRNPGNLNR